MLGKQDKDNTKQFLKEAKANVYISHLAYLLKKGVTLEVLEANIAGYAKKDKFIADKGIQYLNQRFDDGSLKIFIRPSRTNNRLVMFNSEVVLKDK